MFFFYCVEMPHYHSDSIKISSIPIQPPVYVPIPLHQSIDLSANTFAWSWQDPEDFVKDMKSYKIHPSPNDSLPDLSGAKVRWAELEKDLQHEKNKVLQESINPIGSKANWGSFLHREEVQGSTLEELGITDVKTSLSAEAKRILVQKRDTLSYESMKNSEYHQRAHQTVYEQGELTAPLVRSIEEEEDAETLSESSWLCKGCFKTFATKASLKRHHDRKKSCKDLCEKPVDLSGTSVEVPDKPYIVDWVEQMMINAISGDLETPYCKHCEIEFANKSNLNKHLSKSVACDKLAKQEFLKLLQSL